MRWTHIRERYFGLAFFYVWLPLLGGAAVWSVILYVLWHFIRKAW